MVVNIKVVKISWKDSSTFKEWYNINELKEIYEVPIINTVGYLIEKNSEYIFVASNNDNEESFSAITCIPVCSIVKMDFII